MRVWREAYQKFKTKKGVMTRVPCAAAGTGATASTALRDDSQNAFLIIECVDPKRCADLEAALSEFAELMERYLVASIEYRAVIDRTHPEAVIVA